MRVKILFIVLLFMPLGINPLKGQSIIERIESGLNSVVTASAFDKKGVQIKQSVAFFISSDGLAIVNSSLMQNADSIMFKDNTGKIVELNNIVAFHTFGDLALVHLKMPKPNTYSFLNPSKNAYSGESEILAFVDPNDSQEGLSYGKIEKIQHCLYGGRLSLISVKGGETSDCAPVIDNKGNFIGIYRFNGNANTGILFPATYITDTTWVSINQKWAVFKYDPKRELLTSPHFCRSVMLISEGKWVESANNITDQMKFEPENSTLYSLRAFCRFKYGNNTGGNNDFSKAEKLNPDDHIAYFARATFHLARKDPKKALDDLLTAIEKNPDFALAFLEIGRLQVLDNDIRRAFASFTYSLQTDSLLAEAWYERGRLSLLHSSNMNNALNDLYNAGRLNPWLDGVYSMTGEIRLKNKEYSEAIMDFDKAILKNPDDVHAIINRGVAYYNNNLKEKACADWENASKKGNTQAIRLLQRNCTATK